MAWRLFSDSNWLKSTRLVALMIFLEATLLLYSLQRLAECLPSRWMRPANPSSTLRARKSLIRLDRGSKAQTTNRAGKVRRVSVQAVEER